MSNSKETLGIDGTDIISERFIKFTMILVDTMISVVYCRAHRDVTSTSFPFLRRIYVTFSVSFFSIFHHREEIVLGNVLNKISSPREVSLTILSFESPDKRDQNGFLVH